MWTYLPSIVGPWSASTWECGTLGPQGFAAIINQIQLVPSMWLSICDGTNPKFRFQRGERTSSELLNGLEEAGAKFKGSEVCWIFTHSDHENTMTTCLTESHRVSTDAAEVV